MFIFVTKQVRKRIYIRRYMENPRQVQVLLHKRT